MKGFDKLGASTPYAATALIAGVFALFVVERQPTGVAAVCGVALDAAVTRMGRVATARTIPPVRPLEPWRVWRCRSWVFGPERRRAEARVGAERLPLCLTGARLPVLAVLMSMKLARNTPEQLIVEETPWLLGILLSVFTLIFVGAGIGLVASGEVFGLVFALGGGGLGGLCLALMVQRVQVILDRPSDALIVRRRDLLRYIEVRHALSDLSKAVLEETRGSKGSTLWRPTLILDRGMSAGAHPIVSVYTNGSSPRRMAGAINNWLAVNGPRARLDSAAPSA